jgi:hypothetical protein
MKKKIKITIPQDLTIDHYLKLGQFDNLREIEKVIRIISSISGYTEEEIRLWDIGSINKIHNDIQITLNNITPVFLPVFTFKGINYGMQPLHKMSGAEFIDLEKRLEKGNILEVMSIIYRPITEDKFDSTWWKIKRDLKYIAGKADDLFKYYKVEEYDTEKREWRMDIFKELPISLAIGAYNFFLLLAIQLSNYTLQSLEELPLKEKEMLKEQMENLFKNISAGFTLSTDLQKMEGYSDSQEKLM